MRRSVKPDTFRLPPKEGFVRVDAARMDCLTAISRWEERYVLEETPAELSTGTLRVLPDVRWRFRVVHLLAQDAEKQPAKAGLFRAAFLHEDERVESFFAPSPEEALRAAAAQAKACREDLAHTALFLDAPVTEALAACAIAGGHPVLVSTENPTDRAVALAKRYRLNLLCAARPASVDIYASRGVWAI